VTVEGWLYRGCVYRQLLEARWAGFFDALGLAYSYEVGGLEPACGRWIPSGFWLPEVGRQVEVREWPRRQVREDFWPEHPAWVGDDEDVLLDGPAGRLVVIYGPPYYKGKPHAGEHAGYRIATAGDLADDFLYGAYIRNDNQYLWTECPACGKVGIEYEGRAGRLCACFGGADKVRNNLSPRLVRAYEAAWADAHPVRRRLWRGLLRPALDRRLMRG
jgi:hypothetical protein